MKPGNRPYGSGAKSCRSFFLGDELNFEFVHELFLERKSFSVILTETSMNLPIHREV